MLFELADYVRRQNAIGLPDGRDQKNVELTGTFAVQSVIVMMLKPFTTMVRLTELGFEKQDGFNECYILGRPVHAPPFTRSDAELWLSREQRDAYARAQLS